MAKGLVGVLCFLEGKSAKIEHRCDVREQNNFEEEANYSELAYNEGLIIAGKLPSFDSHAFNCAPEKES